MAMITPNKKLEQHIRMNPNYSLMLKYYNGSTATLFRHLTQAEARRRQTTLLRAYSDWTGDFIIIQDK